MGKKVLDAKQIKEIIDLRKTGHSLPEIKRITGRAAGSVSKYIKGVEVLDEYKEILKEKQGGSKERAKKNWLESQDVAAKLIGSVSDRDRVIFLAGLYWGEGTKKELNLINGNPFLVKSFIQGLYVLGVSRKDLKINLRVYSGMKELDIKEYWSKFLDVPRTQFGKSEMLKGVDFNKLPQGMCRVRVTKGGEYFKQIISVIDFIKQ